MALSLIEPGPDAEIFGFPELTGSKNCLPEIGGGGGGGPITEEVDNADNEDIEDTDDLPIRRAIAFPESFFNSCAA